MKTTQNQVFRYGTYSHHKVAFICICPGIILHHPDDVHWLVLSAFANKPQLMLLENGSGSTINLPYIGEIQLIGSTFIVLAQKNSPREIPEGPGTLGGSKKN